MDPNRKIAELEAALAAERERAGAERERAGVALAAERERARAALAERERAEAENATLVRQLAEATRAAKSKLAVRFWPTASTPSAYDFAKLRQMGAQGHVADHPAALAVFEKVAVPRQSGAIVDGQLLAACEGPAWHIFAFRAANQSACYSVAHCEMGLSALLAHALQINATPEVAPGLALGWTHQMQLASGQGVPDIVAVVHHPELRLVPVAVVELGIDKEKRPQAAAEVVSLLGTANTEPALRTDFQLAVALRLSATAPSMQITLVGVTLVANKSVATSILDEWVVENRANLAAVQEALAWVVSAILVAARYADPLQDLVGMAPPVWQPMRSCGLDITNSVVHKVYDYRRLSDEAKEQRKRAAKMSAEFLADATLTDNVVDVQILRYPLRAGTHMARYPTDFVPVIRALQGLHSRGVVHGDIRGMNILFGNMEQPLIDFDFAVEIGKPYEVELNTDIKDGCRHDDAVKGNAAEAAHDWFSLAQVMHLHRCNHHPAEWATAINLTRQGQTEAAIRQLEQLQQPSATLACDYEKHVEEDRGTGPLGNAFEGWSSGRSSSKRRRSNDF